MNFPLKFGQILIKPESLEDVFMLKQFSDTLIDEKAMIGRKEKRTLEGWRKSVEFAIEQIEKRNAVVLLAHHNNRVVGLAAIFRQNQKMDHIGGLGLMVAKDYRQKGLGTYLLSNIVQWGKDTLPWLECIELGVISKNKPAKHLYEKFGFSRIAIIPGKIKHFGKYYTEEIMQKWLITSPYTKRT